MTSNIAYNNYEAKSVDLSRSTVTTNGKQEIGSWMHDLHDRYMQVAMMLAHHVRTLEKYKEKALEKNAEKNGCLIQDNDQDDDADNVFAPKAYSEHYIQDFVAGQIALVNSDGDAATYQAQQANVTAGFAEEMVTGLQIVMNKNNVIQLNENIVKGDLEKITPSKKLSKTLSIIGWSLFAVGVAVAAVSLAAVLSPVLAGLTIGGIALTAATSSIGIVASMAGGAMQVYQGIIEIKTGSYMEQLSEMQKNAGSTNSDIQLQKSSIDYMQNNQDRNLGEASNWSNSYLQGLKTMGSFFKTLQGFANSL